ncbi:hypothetical protein [Nocardia carnea]|uniref:hypothetical protein n=1 Tax=Nocardia carnea TaxID=37328 RepID=UPI0012F70659|nr:hypothetical protein [Nocardia carnea]
MNQVVTPTGLTAEPGLTQPVIAEFTHPVRDTGSVGGVMANGVISRRRTGRAEGEVAIITPVIRYFNMAGSLQRQNTVPRLNYIG